MTHPQNKIPFATYLPTYYLLIPILLIGCKHDTMSQWISVKKDCMFFLP